MTSGRGDEEFWVESVWQAAAAAAITLRSTVWRPALGQTANGVESTAAAAATVTAMLRCRSLENEPIVRPQADGALRQWHVE